jgi:glucose dehydrogenase
MNTKDSNNLSRRDFTKVATAIGVGSGIASIGPSASDAKDAQRKEGEPEYDVVIIGAGCAGALAANSLARRGRRVLILEAGPEMRHPSDRTGHYYAADAKTPESPWPNAPEADRPHVLDQNSRQEEFEDGKKVPNFKLKKHYVIQNGAGPFNSTYERVRGGTLNHWLGTCLRHVPNDFNLKSKYYDKDEVGSDGKPLLEHAQDWPIDYNDIEKWYQIAEKEVGVAGDSDNYQGYLGADRSADYPMKKIPLSYLDKQFQKYVHGTTIKGRKAHVIATPQARNSRDFDNRPKCMGNSSCVPICPIQAKYDATVHLKKAVTAGATIQYQSVAYRVEISDDKKDKDRVAKIHYKRWGDGDPKDCEVTAKVYVLAAHAIETAKLLLISPWKKSKDKKQKFTAVANSSDQVGRNLMDHIIYLAWGLARNPVYPYRGPLSTTGIGDFRDDFGPNRQQPVGRKQRAAYRIEIGNDGLVWPKGAPGTTIFEQLQFVMTRIINQLKKEAKDAKDEDRKKDTGKENKNGGQAPKNGETPLQANNLNGAKYRQDGAMVFEARREKPQKLDDIGFGEQVRTSVRESVIRHVRLASEMEGLPLEDSQVSVSSKISADGSFDYVPDDEKDVLGIPKPQINYEISEYSKRGFVESVDTLHEILVKMGVEEVASNIANIGPNGTIVPDNTKGTARFLGETTAGVFDYEGKRYEYRGAGHIMGTYRMGDKSNTSVVDPDCRSHDHKNLYLLGSGVFPSSGTGNPTITIMALALRAADQIDKDLKRN